MKKYLTLCLILCVAILSGCDGAQPSVNGPTENQVSYLGENYEHETLTIGTEAIPGGSCYDLSGLYLKVLEDLWGTDAGLNGDITYISVDLSKAPGELTEGEKSAISYIFAKAHEKQCLGQTGTQGIWKRLCRKS